VLALESQRKGAIAVPSGVQWRVIFSGWVSDFSFFDTAGWAPGRASGL